MKIAVIGSGNVGSTLALAFQKAGHDIVFGVRNTESFKGKEFAIQHNLAFKEVSESVNWAEVIVVSAPGNLAAEIGADLGDVKGKVVIDTMNTPFNKVLAYDSTADALIATTKNADVIKCFNTTGFENMAHPTYHGAGIDMFIAGDSEHAKKVATQLAKEIGFGEVYDFGGNDKFHLIEQFASVWINLAITQKKGRDIAFKIVRRGH